MSAACCSSRSSFRPSSRHSPRPVCLPHMSHGSHHLIRSPRLVSSAPYGVRCLPHPLASSHRLIGSSLPRIARLPVSSTSRTGRHNRRAITGWRADGGGRRTDGGGCLLVSDGGGTGACLLAFSCPCRSLVAARSLVAIRSVSIVPLVPAWGVVGRFMGYSARYLVGVGVSQNMPLNGILWLLTGIFGDVVRCLFSALFVVSSSPLCPCFPPSPGGCVMAWGGRVSAGSS